MKASVILALIASAAAVSVTLTFDQSKPIHKVADQYVSYNIDTGSIFNYLDFTNAKFINMVANLAPAVVRIGGTAADYSWYLPSSTARGHGTANTIISDATWDSIIAFTKKSGVQLMWDFNGLMRTGSGAGAWNPAVNATAFLAYTNSKYAGMDILWSVGNEPDLWPGTKPGGAQLGADALTLQKLVQNYNVGKNVLGPAYAGFNGDSAAFFRASKGIYGYTSHNYPMARNCNIPEYLSRTPIDGMGSNCEKMAQTKAANANADLLLVLEETGGSYGGGCENITDRFVSGFWYAHALALVGEKGYDRFHRQDIVGWSFTGGKSNYQLIGPPGWANDTATLTPHPDYFTAILFKQIMGRSALNITSETGDAGTIKDASFHVWCANGGGVALTFINPTGNDVTISLTGVADAPRTEFIMTSTAMGYTESVDRVARGRPLSGQVFAPPASLQDDASFLNGVQLVVDDTGKLPANPIPGKSATTGTFTAPPYSYGFSVYTSVSPAACA